MCVCVVCADSLKAGETAEEIKKVKTEPVESETTSVKSKPTSQLELVTNGTTSAATAKGSSVPPAAKTFEFIDGIAAFHATAVKKSQERQTLITNIGPHRRALCARRDLAVRRTLCKVDKVPPYLIPLSECLFVGHTFVSPAETAEAIGMTLGADWIGPMKPFVVGSRAPATEMGNFGGCPAR